MSSVDSALAAPTVQRHPSTGARRARPVLAWASIGTFLAGIGLWAIGSWITRGQAKHVPIGADHPNAATIHAADVFQIGGIVAASLVVGYVVRRSLRERRLCLDAMIVIASMLAWWHDPLINWLRPTLFYNATLVNAGSWTEQIPGWFSPRAHLMPEPVLMIGLAYVWMPLSLGALAGAVMRRVHNRRPHAGVLVILASGYVAVLAVEIALEILAVRTSLVGYPAAPAALTLWAGSTHQLPVYGPMLWSMVLAGVGALRYFVDDTGASLPERGIDRVAVGPRLSTTLRVLAVVGFVNVMAVVGYDLPVIAGSLYASRVDTYPTYLRTQQCGPGTPFACPGPHVPIVGRP